MDRFPLPASAAYSYQQNFTTEHHGIDLMAPLGTPVLAVESGVAWASVETKGGNVVYLDGARTGNRYFYGHLDRFAAKVLINADPRVRVDAGDELGYVGTTGNAAGRPPHVHFQMRRGSLVMDPFEPLQKVDPQPRRGSSGPTVHRQQRPSGAAAAFCLLALLWLVAKR